MGECIQHLASGWDVAALQQQLAAHPELWDQHAHRTFAYGPHRGISDIWVRYRDFAEFTGDVAAFHTGAHASTWYPCITQIPAAWSLARKVRRYAGAAHIGGVLITRIPPGGEVKPHVDHGWHAEAHRKYIVQVQAAPGQAFCFDNDELRPETGDLYTFRNDVSHWVTNPTDVERISLIVCLR